MTRIESSARDYAIASLSSVDLSPLDALQAVMRLDGFGCWLEVNNAAACGMASADPMTALRILRARVALYLRLLRRCEASERGERWAAHIAHGFGGVGCVAYFGGGWNNWRAVGHMLRAEPWRPLWTSAPAHDPNITPRQRGAAA